MKLTQTIFVLYIVSVLLGCALSAISLPEPFDVTEGYYRHAITGSTIACVSSSLLPFSGEVIVAKIGPLYESLNNSGNLLDTEADIYYNSVGASVGSDVGSLIFAVWFGMLAIHTLKILCFSRNFR